MRKTAKKLHQWVRYGRYWLNKFYKLKGVGGLMRFGHAAKGLLYGMIGLISVRSVIYDAKPAGGTETVLALLGSRAIGSLLLLVLAVGLLGYTLWRFIQAILDPDHQESLNVQRVTQRCGYVISGLTYGSIAYTAAQLSIGLTVDFDDTVEDLASVLFEFPVGSWALAGIGAGVILVGLTYVYGAVSGSFISDFQTKLYTSIKHTAVWMGKVGFTARGVSFILIGTYLIRAAYFSNEDQAGGLGEILDMLDDQPFGKIWLSAIAFGFIAYASYMIIAALYRKFPSSAEEY